MHLNRIRYLNIFFFLLLFFQSSFPFILKAQISSDSSQVKISINSGILHIGFDQKNGELVELIDRKSGLNFIAQSQEIKSHWQLNCVEKRKLTSLDAGRFYWEKHDNLSLQLIWDQFSIEGAPDLRIVVTVQILKTTPISKWHIHYENAGDLRIESIYFPRLPNISYLGDNERLAVPRFMGELAKSPRELYSKTGKTRRRSWIYPGELALQCLALYQQNGPGLYLASDDTAAFRKAFIVFSKNLGSLGYEMAHYPENPDLPKNRYTLPYSCLIGSFEGDWITAAERYRSWGIKQSWARKSRFRKRLVPKWLLDTAMWMWNRGRAAGVLPPAIALQRELGLPISVFWHWWHKGPYDTSFPDYLPPRDGSELFNSKLRQAQIKGIKTIIYMNQRLWCMTTKSWDVEGAKHYAVKNRDGKFRIEKPCVFDRQPCATMCISTSFWRDKYSNIAIKMIKDYGVNGIYMDQAVSSIACFDPNHGHPVGGGNYWMNGFKKLEAGIRKQAQRDILLAGEHGCETWLPVLDLFLTLQISEERYKRPGGDGWEVIPFFQAVYHPYALTYGSYSSLTIPPYDEFWPKKYAPEEPLCLLDNKYNQQFYLEQARAFVWGMQPTVANFFPSQINERSEEINYMKRLVKIRSRALKYLLYGIFQRPPVIDIPRVDIELSRVSIYAGRMGGGTSWKARYPALLTSAWQAEDGDLAIVFASIVKDTLSLKFDVDPNVFGLEKPGKISRIDEYGAEVIGKFNEKKVHFEFKLHPLKAMILEFTNGE